MGALPGERRVPETLFTQGNRPEYAHTLGALPKADEAFASCRADPCEPVEHNDANAAMAVPLTARGLALNFLRHGSLTPTRWENFNFKRELWSIIADRMETRKSQQATLTDTLKELHEALRQLIGTNKYALPSQRVREYQHVHKDSLNADTQKSGYKGLTTAIGFRQLVMTAEQEVLKLDHESIQ